MIFQMRRLFILTTILMAVCCSKDAPIGSGGNVDDGQGDTPKPVSLFDYSKMGEHPRLLVRMEDFDRMQSAIDSDSRLAAVHQQIIDRGESLLAQEPLTYEKVGKRLLNVSRAAIERILNMSYLYRMTGEERYLAKAEATINEVSSFPDWNQSEHYLDVAEMAFGVAIGLDWLYDELQPATKENAKIALKTYAFDTYMTEDGDVFRRSVSN